MTYRNIQAAGTLATKFRSKNKTLRVPVLLTMANVCTGFPTAADVPSTRKPVSEADKAIRAKFVEEIHTIANRLGRATKGAPEIAQTDFNFYDSTLHYEAFKEEIAAAGSVRYYSNFESVPTGMYPASPFAPKLQNGLIISGQVTIIEVDGKLRLVPLTIVLANALGRILALCPGAPYQGAGAASRHPLGESMSAAQLRRRILQLLGANNILVGFHLGWILTSIELQLPAHRVVELGEEPAFQHYVQAMSVKNGFTDDFFRGDQIPSFDRRWPAVFSGGYFSFGRGAALAIRETFYFAAL